MEIGCIDLNWPLEGNEMGIRSIVIRPSFGIFRTRQHGESCNAWSTHIRREVMLMNHRTCTYVLGRTDFSCFKYH